MAQQPDKRRSGPRAASPKVADAELRGRHESAEQVSQKAGEGIVMVPLIAEEVAVAEMRHAQGQRESLADALDVPAELLEGQSGVGHWSDHAPLGHVPGDAEYNSSPGGDRAPDTDGDESPALQDEPGRLPVPRAVRHTWWPAAVKLPGNPQPIRVAKVYATAQGLYIYSRVPTGDHMPDWWSPVDYDKTRRPTTGYAARQTGNPIMTSAGLVTIQPLGGCGCSYGALKRYSPPWASRVEAWEV